MRFLLIILLPVLIYNCEVKPIRIAKNQKNCNKEFLFHHGIKSIEVLPFIYQDYQIHDLVEGDLNMDKFNDIVLILNKINEDTFSVSQNRKFIILIRDNLTQKLSKQMENDSLLYCFDCGGSLGDPYVGTKISKGNITIEHFGGGWFRYSKFVNFNYDKTLDSWSLDSIYGTYLDLTEKEITFEPYVNTRTEFGQIDIKNYSVY